MKFTLFSLIILSCFYNLNSQTNSLNGKILDKTENLPLIGATVELTKLPDSTKQYDRSNPKGEFEIKNVAKGKYSLKITYIGYEPIIKLLELQNDKDYNLNSISMSPSQELTDAIEVVGKAHIGSQDGDTTSFNATSFKTNPDATVEDLVKKMPGIMTGSDGTLQAKGEEVKRVLVDGKPFFGDDPSAALKNIPADVVDKIQVYDKATDQSRFSGFDDGNAERTINIITKPDRKKGEFGKFIAGGGNLDRYSASLNYNSFEGSSRITVLGLSNNINQQNFSMNDLFGFMGSSGGDAQRRFQQYSRGGGMGGGRPGFTPGFMSGVSGIMVGQQNGINTTHSAGISYNNIFDNNFEFSGNYFFNYSGNTNESDVNRSYFQLSDSTQLYDQFGDNGSTSMNHRMNFEMKYQLDSNNQIIFKPNLRFQPIDNDTISKSQNYFSSGTQLNSSDNKYQSESDGIDLSSDLTYLHSFELKGRTLSLNLVTNYNNKESVVSQYANNTFYSSGTPVNDILDLKSNTPANGLSYSTEIEVTEPVGEFSQIKLEHDFSSNRSNSDKRTDLFDFASNSYMLDTLLSNKFVNDYSFHKFAIGYKYNIADVWSLDLSLDYQLAKLQGNQDFPFESNIEYNFNNILPRVRFTYKFDKNSDYRLFYRTRTSAPSISQLQNVVDFTNPLQISAGNSSLRQQLSYSLFNRYSSMSEDFKNVFFIMLGFTFNEDYIGNSYIIAQNDTSISTINGNIPLLAGSQYTQPVNMQDNYTVFSNFSYSFPLYFIKSNFNLNLGMNYSQTPSMINGTVNLSRSIGYTYYTAITSNISENLDFNISSRGSFNNTLNTILSNQNNNFNNFANSINLNWIFWEGFFVQTDLANQLYTGLTLNDNVNFTLWNINFGKKLFNNAAEIRFTIFDILDQNRNIRTNVTDFYLEYARNQVLSQYVMLSFTYNLRNFGGGSSSDDTDKGKGRERIRH